MVLFRARGGESLNDKISTKVYSLVPRIFERNISHPNSRPHVPSNSGRVSRVL